MEVESVGDVASLDPDLLQLPELSMVALKSNLYVVDELFSQFLSIPETGRLVPFLAHFSFLLDAFLLDERCGDFCGIFVRAWLVDRVMF